MTGLLTVHNHLPYQRIPTQTHPPILLYLLPVLVVEVVQISTILVVVLVGTSYHQLRERYITFPFIYRLCVHRHSAVTSLEDPEDLSLARSSQSAVICLSLSGHERAGESQTSSWLE